MIAPSELHLQNYIQNHPEIFEELHEGSSMYEYEIFKREAVLPSGRADFLAVQLSETICVIETKKNEITSKAIAQTLRYIRDIKEIWKYAIGGTPDPDPIRQSYARVPKVNGILIGSSISDDLLVSAEGAGIDVFLYDFDGVDYSIASQRMVSNEHLSLDYAYGYIGEICRETYMTWLEAYYGKDIERMHKTGLTVNEYRNYLNNRDSWEIPG